MHPQQQHRLDGQDYEQQGGDFAGALGLDAGTRQHHWMQDHDITIGGHGIKAVDFFVQAATRAKLQADAALRAAVRW